MKLHVILWSLSKLVDVKASSFSSKKHKLTYIQEIMKGVAFGETFYAIWEWTKQRCWKSQLDICSPVKNCQKNVASSSKVLFLDSFFSPLPFLVPLSGLGGGLSSERHELKLPFGLPFGHPDRVGGVLRHLHDADGERRLISLVDMVSHYLSRGEGKEGRQQQEGKLARRLWWWTVHCKDATLRGWLPTAANKGREGGMGQVGAQSESRRDRVGEKEDRDRSCLITRDAQLLLVGLVVH